MKQLVLGAAFVSVAAAATLLFVLSGSEPGKAKGPVHLEPTESGASDPSAPTAPPSARPAPGRARGSAPLPKPAAAPPSLDSPPPVQTKIQKGAQVLKGCVLNSGGDPLPSAAIELFVVDGGTPLAPGQRVRVAAPALSDGKGCFAFSSLDGGPGYLLHVEHGSYAPFELGDLEVPQSAPLVVPDIRMTPGAEIVGTVSDENQKPLQNALVAAWSQKGPLDSARGYPVRQVLTDEKGDYHLEHLALASYQLVVVANDKRTVRKPQLELGTVNQKVRADFRLEPGLTVRGKIVTETKDPIANAVVEARSHGGANSSVARAVSRENGLFELSGLGPDELRLDVRCPGYLPQSVFPVVPTDAKPRLIALHATAGITGFVIDKETQKPITSFGLMLWTIGKGDRLNERLGDLRVVEQSADGSFTIEDVPPGRYRVQAFANDHGAAFTKTFEVKRKYVFGVTIELDRGATVRGRAVDAQGKPLAGASVRMFDNAYQKGPLSKMLYGEYAELAQPVTSGADGVFRFEHQGPQTVQLRATAPGKMPVVLRDVVIAEGGETNVGDFRLGDGAGLRGVIIDVTGPAKGARVSLIAKQGEAETTKTNSDGEYSFEHLPPGEYTLSAEPIHTNAGSGNFLVDAITAGKTAKQVTLVDGSTLTFDLSLVPVK